MNQSMKNISIFNFSTSIRKYSQIKHLSNDQLFQGMKLLNFPSNSKRNLINEKQFLRFRPCPRGGKSKAWFG
jgi:hypothetical protein